jgi:hypothetical protein
MSHAIGVSQIADLVDELIALFAAQSSDLREYAKAIEAGEGTVHLERTLQRREVQRAELYGQFEQAAFPVSAAPASAVATSVSPLKSA